MADPRDAQRPQYPPPDDSIQAGYYAQQSPQRSAARDDRSGYPPPEPARPQYPDPRTGHPYPPPHAWPGQHGAYPHYPDPAHPAYGYPPRPDLGQPPPPMQPDAYRLPPVYAHPHAGYYSSPYPPPAPAAAPRQRTAIACKYCRKRKIRCSGYDSSPDGRCQNCVRFNQQCLFHPVSSQAAFVPANAVYGPNAARAPIAGQPDGRAGQNGHHYAREGDPPPMLYGAHGQPLGPAGPHGQPQYSYPPPPHAGYPPAPYPYTYPPASAPPPYDAHGQGHAAQHDERVSLKRPPPDDDPHNEKSHASQSPHPTSRARNSTYESRQNSSGSYDYADHPSGAPTSPATSTMSYQSFPQQQQARYANGHQPQKGNVSPSGLTPQSAQSYNSPRQAPAGYDDGRTPPPNQPGSAGSSTNGRSGMKVHEMIDHTRTGVPDLRGKNDNDMLSKLDGKK
ncbi:hypothetical protein AYL99_09037 [Fonsecaea erecta]|uniref:Zn(2)-C6 fungal-type domain-containing protein n=1 Tax=Fonsecaea erecta TaxID=1367422 RepID=A0A178ZCX2_9EURO|nr:hypothetical protein AYL99_09037 [Fonsecaea erecta]OAP56925.1 hypothetical protein AYL99_09037 [Fonsecaea erecta]